jgi:hypothetical protein
MKYLKTYEQYKFRELTEEQESNPFAVFVLVKLPNGKYAATTRAEDKGEQGKIGLPGGKVDPNEDPKIAAIREAEEEGWKINSIGSIVASRMVDNRPVIWYSGHDAEILTDYKEKKRGIVPITVSKHEISNSGYGNEFILQL